MNQQIQLKPYRREPSPPLLLSRPAPWILVPSHPSIRLALTSREWPEDIPTTLSVWDDSQVWWDSLTWTD